MAVFLDILYKSLIFVAVGIFSYIAYTKINVIPSDISFKSQTTTSSSKGYMPKELIWYDDFKGIENCPSKKQEHKVVHNGTGGTGFKFQGLNK